MMSSKQIVKILTGNTQDSVRHDNVKRTMDRLSDRGVIHYTPMEEDAGYNNKKGEVYYVNEDDSMTVVAQLYPEFTKHIVMEWRMLRNENVELKQLIADQSRQLNTSYESLTDGYFESFEL